ncbi:hypothetical protein IEQ34_012128 [Dendrobium chrysotoxum]|uniref:Uncharacterized protein n=1 Tax=Dendrobium chrysotoxum TaxID=161865 RepID=A0AAV7GC10_DENCH|nr:hypothetical protein IEQ34_012128 [Dendrobium chrysotoxum]
MKPRGRRLREIAPCSHSEPRNDQISIIDRKINGSDLAREEHSCGVTVHAPDCRRNRGRISFGLTAKSLGTFLPSIRRRSRRRQPLAGGSWWDEDACRPSFDNDPVSITAALPKSSALGVNEEKALYLGGEGGVDDIPSSPPSASNGGEIEQAKGECLMANPVASVMVGLGAIVLSSVLMGPMALVATLVEPVGVFDSPFQAVNGIEVLLSIGVLVAPTCGNPCLLNLVNSHIVSPKSNIIVSDGETEYSDDSKVSVPLQPRDRECASYAGGILTINGCEDARASVLKGEDMAGNSGMVDVHISVLSNDALLVHLTSNARNYEARHGDWLNYDFSSTAGEDFDEDASDFDLSILQIANVGPPVQKGKWKKGNRRRNELPIWF